MTEPRPGDFGLTTISGAPGLGVRLGERLLGGGARSRYQHAFLVLDNGEVLEAEPGGAVIRPLSSYDGAQVTYSGWPLSDAQRVGIVKTGRIGLKGVGYSWLDYAAIAARRLGFGTDGLQRFIENSGHMICSQLVDYAYLNPLLVEPVHLFNDGRWPGYVPPSDLALVLKGPA